jgi:hypothetical protein
MEVTLSQDALLFPLEPAQSANDPQSHETIPSNFIAISSNQQSTTFANNETKMPESNSQI